MGALVESERLTDGPPAKGSRYRDVFENHGQRLELEAELVELEEPRTLVVQLASDVFDATITQRLEAVDAGTRLPAVIEQLENDLERLKELVEGGQPPPAQ